MAQTEHLPIYKASYDLCLYLEQVVRGFSRYHTYTLGTDLRDGAPRILKLVVRANARRDKARSRSFVNSDTSVIWVDSDARITWVRWTCLR
jgi:hypothetical protein